MNEAPIALVSGLGTEYCANDDVAILTPTPPGGTFSGLGVIDNTFDPGLAGAGGPYTVSYTYTDSVGCATTISQDITVYPYANTVIRGVDEQYCISFPADVLVIGFPEGGTLTGAGVRDNEIFNPADAGVGVHTLIYEYENGPGCISFSQVVVTVTNCRRGFGFGRYLCISKPNQRPAVHQL